MLIITGSNGFIGKNLVNLVDDLAAGTGEHESPVYTCDYTNSDIHPDEIISFIKGWGSRITAVIHLGATSDTTVPATEELMNNNVNFTMELYEACKEFEIKFIYASSAATYGDGSKGYYDEDDLEYLKSLNPLNPYGSTKALVDKQIFESIDRGEGKPPQLVGLKFFNVYGPHEEHKGHMRSIISKMYDQIMSTGRANLFKSYNENYDHGMQCRDFIHVDDCINVIYWLLRNEDVNGLFNVGTGRPSTFYCLASHVFHHMDHPFNVKFIDMPDNIKNQYQYSTKASMSKLRGAGYKEPFLSIGEGVEKYINFLTNDAEGSNYNTKEV